MHRSSRATRSQRIGCKDPCRDLRFSGGGQELWPHNIDRVEWAINKDYPAALQALLDGRTTLLTWPLPEQLERLKLTPGIKVVETNTIRSVFLVGRNPFKDRRVRQGIYQAIDIERLIRDVQKGYGVPAGMPIPPGINGYASDLDQRLPYDPEKARALLAEAGYPDCFSVQLDTVAGTGYADPEVDALIDQIEGQMVTYVRDGLIEKVWRKVLGDIVYVPLYRPINAWALRADLDLPLSVMYGGRPEFRDARYTTPAGN
jgi:ABC-type oligopeptide transport system substrate-binding subunit